MDFQRGSRHTRQQVSDILGGSIQGGIITTRKTPVVILYSDSHGGQFGYRDEWKDDGFFHYTGAGQTGPMRMWKGNKAVRDHVKDRKSLMLFIETEEKRVYRFEGSMQYVDHYEKEIPDSNGQLRTGIIFRLLPVLGPDGEEPVEQSPEQSPEALRKKAIEASTQAVDKAMRSVTYRERSRTVKAWVLARSQGFCEGCGEPAPFVRKNGSTPYLETHHIHCVSDDGPDAPSAVIALCPTCHRRVHYGEGGMEYNEELRQIPRKAEEAYASNRLMVVTAAVISDASRQVLVCQRSQGSLSGHWEFPGGKVQEGEKPEDCVKREVREELRITLDDVVPFMMTDYDYGDSYIRLLCYEGTATGAPVLTEHSAARWVQPGGLGRVSLAPADMAVGKRLTSRRAVSDPPLTADRERMDYRAHRR